MTVVYKSHILARNFKTGDFFVSALVLHMATSSPIMMPKMHATAAIIKVVFSPFKYNIQRSLSISAL